MTDKKDDDSGDLGPSVEEYVRALMDGGVFRPPSVDDEPVIEVRTWEVMEVTGTWGTSHHIVGVWDDCGRVSSPVEQFSPEQRQIKTRSGRIYVLGDSNEGRFDEIKDRDHVRDVWLRMNGIPKDTPTDVTEAYLSKLK